MTRRNRASRTETAAEEVPPGVPFWDWICKSICNLLPFSKDAKGSKSHRGANIQRLVDDVMATSQEVVQAKRRLQSTNGSVEASVKSMGELETKLWKLIDLEVDLVNELARYRWSGDVQDPKAEMKLNTAEEKIWRVIGVQTRLAQDLGDWRKTSARSAPNNSGFDTQAFRAPYGGPGQYGAFNPAANYGPTGPYNDSFGNPSSRGNNPGMYAGRGNFRSPSPQVTEEAEGGSVSESPSLSQSPPSPQRSTSRKSRRRKRSPRRKKKGRRRSPTATGSPTSKSRKSSKRRNRSRVAGASDSTSNSSTNTSMHTTEPTSTENTSSTNGSTSGGSDKDSVTITNTIVISSEFDDEAGEGNKPSAVSWRSPSKEFLSSIDRSQATPVEWETKKKGKYIYVRAKPQGTRRSASYGGPDRGGYADRRGGESRALDRRADSRRQDRYVGGDVDRRRGRSRRGGGAEEDVKISTVISAGGSDGSGSSYDGGAGGERGGTRRRRRRMYRSAGPTNGRSTYQSRSQWSL